MTRQLHRFTPATSAAAGLTGSVRRGLRDVRWGRPVFRAPLLDVRPPAQPLPFTVARVTGQTLPPARTAHTAA